MAGIYIHIPFCKKACHYCNFHFSTQTKYIERFTNALLMEMEIQKNYLSAPIETVYFGGGTPSLLPMDAFHKIVEKLRATFYFNDQVEFTIEANPDDIDTSIVPAWKKLGVNRLSIGIQSFQPTALKWMNRAHNTKQAHQAIIIAQAAGIENISVDLIYGTPQLTHDALKKDLEIIQQYEVQHLSCYAITVEEKTTLHSMILSNKMEPIQAEHQAAHFEMICAFTENIGMEHYEISNFSKPGFRSQHNSNYWQGIPYLGLGPSAHSYNKDARQWNVANNQLYFTSLEKNQLPFHIETLSIPTKYNEYIMISLRCMEGLSLRYILDHFGVKFRAHTLKIATRFLAENLLKETDQGFTLSKTGKFLADGIASDFFWVDEPVKPTRF